MKNIFKVMGVALLACSMVMVSCKNDDDKDNPAENGKMVVKLGNDGFTAASVQCIDYTADGYVTIYGYATAQNTNGLYVQGYLESEPISNGTYEGTDGDIMNWRDPQNPWVDENGVMGQGAGTAFWATVTVPETFIENITAVDLNALTMSGNWSAKTIQMAEYATVGAIDGCTQTDFTGEMNNMTWTWGVASK